MSEQQDIATKDFFARVRALGLEKGTIVGIVDRLEAVIKQRDELLEANRILCEDIAERHNRIAELKQQRDDLLAAIGVAQATMNCAGIDTPGIVARTVEKYADAIANVTGSKPSNSVGTGEPSQVIANALDRIERAVKSDPA